MTKRENGAQGAPIHFPNTQKPQRRKELRASAAPRENYFCGDWSLLLGD